MRHPEPDQPPPAKEAAISKILTCDSSPGLASRIGIEDARVGSTHTYCPGYGVKPVRFYSMGVRNIWRTVDICTAASGCSAAASKSPTTCGSDQGRRTRRPRTCEGF